jgi:hypothetical protein
MKATTKQLIGENNLSSLADMRPDNNKHPNANKVKITPFV